MAFDQSPQPGERASLFSIYGLLKVLGNVRRVPGGLNVIKVPARGGGRCRIRVWHARKLEVQGAEARWEVFKGQVNLSSKFSCRKWIVWRIGGIQWVYNSSE